MNIKTNVKSEWMMVIGLLARIACVLINSAFLAAYLEFRLQLSLPPLTWVLFSSYKWFIPLNIYVDIIYVSMIYMGFILFLNKRCPHLMLRQDYPFGGYEKSMILIFPVIGLCEILINISVLLEKSGIL